MNTSFKAGIATILVGSMTVMSASGPAIGMATASGSFRINDSSVKGSASVLEGTRVATDLSPSYLILDNGAQLSLAQQTSGQVYHDRAVLERGSIQIDKSNQFSIETQSVRVAASDSSSRVRVAVGDARRVSVSVLSGEAKVTNLKGVEVARVYPGEPLTFTLPEPPQAGATTMTKISGCVKKVMINGKAYYELSNGTAKVRVELSGPLAAKLDGQYVELEGTLNTTATPTVKGATQVIEVVKIDTQRKEAACHAGVSPWWAATVAGIPGGFILLGGVIVAGGTLGGLAAAGAGPFAGQVAPIAGPSVSIP